MFLDNASSHAKKFNNVILKYDVALAISRPRHYQSF